MLRGAAVCFDKSLDFLETGDDAFLARRASTLLLLRGEVGEFFLACVLYALSGISFQSFYIFRTRVQEQVPIDVQGRVMAMLITSVGVCRLVVYGILAVVASTVTLRMIYAVGGLALAVLGVVVTVRAFQRPFASAPPDEEPTWTPGTPEPALAERG